jgi:putative flippase GtrA
LAAPADSFDPEPETAVEGNLAHHPLLLIRFGLVGLLNTAFGYCVFAGLVVFGLRSGFALVLATLAGAAFNFQTSRHLVFRNRARKLRFVAVYVLVLALNWLSLRGLQRLGLSRLAVQALLALPIAAASFVLQRLYVFDRRNA